MARKSSNPGNHRDAQHDPPSIAADEQVVGEIGHEYPDRDRHLIHGDEAAPILGGRVLGPVERGRHRRNTHPGAQHQATHYQHARSRSQRLQQGTDHEDDGGEKNRETPTQAFGQRARGQGPDHGAQRHPTGDYLDYERARVEVLLDAVEGAGDDALVVSEKETGQHDNRGYGEQIPAQAVTLRLVDRRAGRACVRTQGHLHPALMVLLYRTLTMIPDRGDPVVHPGRRQ
jgi:hypothetical protein